MCFNPDEYKLTINADDGLVIKFNFAEPEKIIGDRSLLGVTDKKLIEDIKAKPFILLRNLHVYIEQNDTKYEFVIPRGFCYDGASVPAFAWVLIGQKTEPRFKIASCVHDYMCENHEVVGNDRVLSTDIFIALCKAFGQFNSVKRFAMKTTINLFQKLFCHWK